MRILMIVSALLSLNSYAATDTSDQNWISSQKLFPVTNAAASSVLLQNSLRTYLLVQNQGASSVKLQFGNSSVSPGLILTTGSSYEPVHTPTDALFIQAVGAGSIQMLILEGQK